MDNRFDRVDNKVNNGFKRLGRWMMILVGAVGYPLIKVMLCFGVTNAMLVHSEGRVRQRKLCRIV